jgi:hypothetical protein
MAGDRGIEPLLRRLECLVLPLYESPNNQNTIAYSQKIAHFRATFCLNLFLCFLESNVLSKGFAVLLELDFLLYSLLILASNVDFSRVFVSECDEFFL